MCGSVRRRPPRRQATDDRDRADDPDARLADVDFDEYIGALGVLAARAIEDVAMLSGEPVALWLERWVAVADPYGSP